MFWLPTFSCWLKQIFWKAFHRLVLFVQVNKETSMDNLLPSHHGSVVRPKERRPDVHQQIPFMRGNTIIRSKTFSPGPQSQYICRVTHTHKRYETSDSKRSDEYSVRYVNWCLTLCCFFLVFQINRSDSDSSTLSKKSPFVRNASERRSMRMKKVKLHFCLLILLSGSLNHVVIWLSISELMRCTTKAPCPGQSTFNVQSTVAFRVWGLHLNAPWWMNLWR